MPAYYCSNIVAFLEKPTETVVGILAEGISGAGYFEHKNKQTEVWKKQINVMRRALGISTLQNNSMKEWGILFEYPIPRRQKRIDVVVLALDIIIAIEFKFEATSYDRAAERQIEDYCLDLRDFHKESNKRIIVPILCATGADNRRYEPQLIYEDVRPVVYANASNFSDRIIDSFLAHHKNNSLPLNTNSWNNSEYKPVPTIIEAAELLFSGQDVREISHSHADVYNLTRTTNEILSAIKYAQSSAKKIICFITGVPGAGKTLAGLNIVHNPELRSNDQPAGVFLSGNGPLVKIVSEALARDHSKRNNTTLDESRRVVKTFVQNVHVFLKEYIEKAADVAPYDRVVIFDEAQRAWNAEKEKKKFDRDISEPMMLLDIMDRHNDWAAIVALVGGGQEIHDGEAGLAEWGIALSRRHRDWEIYASPEVLVGGESVAGSLLFKDGIPDNVTIKGTPSLHLKVSIRSFKAEKLTEWVNSVLQGNPKKAALVYKDIKEEFPISLTRSLNEAKKWLGQKTRGLRRCGLVTSSGALRHRAYGLEVSSSFHSDYPFTDWFLAGDDDVRSSYQLEVAATEFECQGLELDWIGICWGNDFTWDAEQKSWLYRQFKGSKWQNVRKEIAKQYLMNKYRVLLTRAREGMVIWVAPGNPNDITLEPAHFDATVDYLLASGLSLLPGEC